MIKKLILVLIFAGLFSSCSRKCDCVLPYQIYYLQAEVKETNNIDCKKTLLSFEADSTRIRLMTGKEDILYIAKGLTPSMNLLDKKLYVDIATLPPAEEFPCTTLGTSYPHIKVLDAKER